MPYITSNARIECCTNGPTCAGDLNYMISALINDYLEKEKLNYQRINDALGALEGAKLELYRRVAAPYEDTKIILNGDVYTVGDK